MIKRTTIQINDDLRKKLKILASERDISYQELLSDMVEVFTDINRLQTVISVPTTLAKKLKEKYPDGSFESLSHYVTFLLREIVLEDQDLNDNSIEKVKIKLKKLGYF